MSQRLTVVAVDGRRIPMEGVPGEIGDEPVEVQSSHYYRSRIASGELRALEAEADPAVAPELTSASMSDEPAADATPSRRTAR